MMMIMINIMKKMMKNSKIILLMPKLLEVTI